MRTVVGGGRDTHDGHENSPILVFFSNLLADGAVVARDDIDVLRPAPPEGIFPYDLPRVLGRRLTQAVSAGEHLRWSMIEGHPDER